MVRIYKYYLLLMMISVSILACYNNANIIDNHIINVDIQEQDSIIMDRLIVALSDVFSIAERTELSQRLKLIMGSYNYEIAASNHNWVSIRVAEEDYLRAIYYDKKSVVQGAFCIIYYDTINDKLSVALSEEDKGVTYFSEDTAMPENLIKEVKELRSNI